MCCLVKMLSFNHQLAGLLIFHVVAELRNWGKSVKSNWNSVEILSNTCLYSNFLSHWGYLLAVNSQIYVKTSSLKRANVLKLPVIDYVGQNWVLAMMLKALPLVHFWSVLLLKEQMMTSVRKHKKRWSDQRKTDRFLAKFALKITTKIHRFFSDYFPAKFAQQIPAKSADFFRNFVPKNPGKFDSFFLQLIRSPALRTSK